MKNTLMNTMIAAAALVVAAGSASAQTYRAAVPMAFHVGNQNMAAGSYDIRVTGGAVGQALIIRNRESSAAAVLVANVRSDPPKTWRESGDPKLAFSCAGDSCTLAKMWDGSSTFAYNFPTPKGPAGSVVAQRLEVVTLSMIKAH